MIALLPFGIISVIFLLILIDNLNHSVKTKKNYRILFFLISGSFLGQDLLYLAHYKYRCTFSLGVEVNGIVPASSIYENKISVRVARGLIGKGYKFIETDGENGKIAKITSDAISYGDSIESRVRGFNETKYFAGVRSYYYGYKDSNTGSTLGVGSNFSTRGGWLLKSINRFLFGDTISMGCVNNRPEPLGEKLLVEFVAPPIR